MTVRTALQQGQRMLAEAGIAEPRLTAEVLMMRATGHDRAWLYAHSTDELTEIPWIHFGRYLHERLEGTPTQYITGRQEFYGREFRVTAAVLIPRPETEHLIEAALAHVQPGQSIWDIGTGSGAIAITLSLESKSRVVATDISLAALAVAQENARRLNARVDFVACDLGAALNSSKVDMIVSNPPYVASAARDALALEVRRWEPPVALFGGDDGLSVYRRLISDAARLLRPDGWLMMELGEAAAVREILEGWRDVSIVNDLAGIPRVIMARAPLKLE